MTIQPTNTPEDARALLATIIDDTREDAEHEERERRLALRSRAEAERHEARRLEDRKRAEAERRLREEAERQRHAQATRLSMVRAIEGPSEHEVAAQRRAEEEARLAAEFQRRLGEAEAARAQAEERAAEAARVARAREEQRLAALSEFTPQQAPRRSGAAVRAFVAAGAAALALSAGVFGLLGAAATDADPPNRIVTKATWSPAALASPATQIGFVPEREEVAEVTEEPEAATRPRWRQRPRNPPASSANPFADIKRGGDVYGSGKD